MFISVLSGDILVVCKLCLDAGFETFFSLKFNQSHRSDDISLPSHSDIRKVCEISAIGKNLTIVEVLVYSIEILKEKSHTNIYIVIISFILLSALLLFKFIYQSGKKHKNTAPIINENIIVDMVYIEACKLLDSICMSDRMV